MKRKRFRKVVNLEGGAGRGGEEMPPSLANLVEEFQRRLDTQRDQILAALQAELRSRPAATASARRSYSVEEVAEILDKSPYTVREWCRHGRIHATKRQEKRGGVELWSIPAEEFARYQDEGLLPLKPSVSAN
ncbi:helix-turn-helix domain-containing protein [Tundrisphaera sp. TA3]|uniref:helix-turn-helix domain-containing protein n=1 Tax=Tundrisphaera sp. TA3 TaxID=3435775 RepID=UPI003EB6AC0C